MRARIIFQGLTLFIPKPLSRGMAKGGLVDSLTALLISDPKHAAMQPPMPLHVHTPRMSVNGRAGNHQGQGTVAKSTVPRHARGQTTTVKIEGQGAPTGVYLDSSFIDYVPCMRELHWTDPAEIQDSFVLARIEFTSGICYARNFIGWNWHGNTPVRIGYMGTTFQGFGANEVVIEMGDDSDVAMNVPEKFLSIDGPNGRQKLWPSIKGRPTDEDIDPNTVEVLFTNFPARRVRAAPHGLHFETTFDAAGYPRDEARYVNTTQYADFAKAMLAYDENAWLEDVDAMGHGQPFPYLVNPRADRLDALEPGAEPPKALLPPPTPGRRAGEGWIPDPHGHHNPPGNKPAGDDPMTNMSTGDDPDNYLICPHGRE